MDQVMQYICSQDLLVLDDLGQQYHTEFFDERLRFVLHARYDSGARTIITSNFSERDLVKQLGAATASRLFDATTTWHQPMMASDYRRERRK